MKSTTRKRKTVQHFFFFFAVKEMQLNSAGVPSVRMAIIKTRRNKNCWKGYMKNEFLDIVHGNTNKSIHY